MLLEDPKKDIFVYFGLNKEFQMIFTIEPKSCSVPHRFYNIFLSLYKQQPYYTNVTLPRDERWLGFVFSL